MKDLKQFIIINLSLCLCLYSYTSIAIFNCSDLYSVTNVASNDTLSIRNGAGVKYKKIGNIPSNGNNIEIVANGTPVERSFWVPIKYEGIGGWVNSRYLKKYCGEANFSCSFEVVNVDFNDTLSVREEPGIQSKKIYQLASNAIDIEVTGSATKVDTSYWVPIKYNDIEGWVNFYYIQEFCFY